MPLRLSGRTHRGIAAAAFVAACISLAGCREESPLARAPVSGTVFSSGAALKSGTIRFVPVEGTKGPTAATAVTDGLYSFTAGDGPVVGKHRVEVVASDFFGFDPGDQEAAERAMKAGAGKLPKNPVPPGYGERSPLRAEVTAAGASGLDFMLSASGPQATR